MGRRRAHRGMVMVYVILTMGVMVGFCSLAVDFGRVQCAKTELRAAADAAAQAAASCLPQGNSVAQSEAIAIAAANKVDGSPLALTTPNVLIGSWNTSTNKFTSGGSADDITTYQAVQVAANRSAANRNAIPLMFGIIIGMPTCNVTTTVVAALMTQPSSTTQYVSAHGNPWLSGQPAGTTGSEPDTGYNSPSPNSTHPWKYDVANPSKVLAAVTAAGTSGIYTPPTDSSKVTSTDYSANEPYASPSGFLVDVTPGSVIQISIPITSQNVANNSGGLTGGTGDTYANGDSGGYYTNISDDAANPTNTQGTTTTSGTEHGISNIIAPLNSVIGVFMDKNGAKHGADSSQETNEASSPATPTGLDFSTQAARDYTTISPQLNQTFYVGNGQTSGSLSQTIVIPPNTYQLFLGSMDGHEWSNNVGGFTTTITQYQIQLVE
jgi:Flp pilus assembly protein TadG